MSELSQNLDTRVTILLVDDEENILRALQRLLMEEEELDIVTATSGEEGLKLLEGLANVALLVSDQRMPGMTGALFLEKAREIAPDALRIILTGYADITAAVDAINRGGAWRYLAKPWNDEELLRIIREGVDRYNILRENRRLNDLVARQNKELEEWNANLKQRILAQTTEIRKKNEELNEANGRLKNAFEGVITAFSELLNLRDQRFRPHGKNVCRMARSAAIALQLPAEEVELIGIAALLHDIGELGIPDDIMAKEPEEMASAEREAYQLHPVRGQAAIDAIEQLRPAGLLIRHHHEYWDGSGFPDGLQKEAIPLGARIIAYADLIDRQMRLDNSELGFGRAMARLELEHGRTLDPQLLGLFRAAAKETYIHLDWREDLKELELQPINLHDGMRLARDVVSGTGLLLLGRGEELDGARIAAIRRYYRIDPPKQGVFVLVTP
ncbi:response regulator [Oryzomonas japonica]|uniref:Response regulator n=1 Tax=Oryzomonas japonica TaxID=2603858 RepID=A0A7J4ZS04_9BACT|nr:HD domain-containing phosphohydrolase [Oryzomonas japonica]KAB0666020.1 response regulator [Oryzomonas japonica]